MGPGSRASKALLVFLTLAGNACQHGAARPPADAGTLACAPGTPAEIEASCQCQAATDCQAGNAEQWACTESKVCVQICDISSDCAPPNEACLDNICIPGGGCGDNSECDGSQTCIGGTCHSAFTAADVARCTVAPPRGVLNASGTKRFTVFSFDSQGNEIAYEGGVTWSVSGLAGTTVVPIGGDQETAVVMGSRSLAAGNGSVDATIGATACVPAGLTSFAAPAAGVLRVTVLDALAGTPLPAAWVVDGAGQRLTGGGDGTFMETNPNPAGTNTVSVFLSGYTYVTITSTSATDLLVPLRPAAASGTFSGTEQVSDFDTLASVVGTGHLSLSGAALPGNLIDSSLTSVLGPGVPTTTNLTGGPIPDMINIPAGIALGLGPTMFKSAYDITAPAGIRALWTLAGNFVVEGIVFCPAEASSSAADEPALFLSQTGDLESGVHAAVSVTAGEQGSISSTAVSDGGAVQLVPDTLRLLQLAVTVPALPAYYLPTDSPGMPTGQLDTAVLVGGVLAPSQGFVPLGIGGGENNGDGAGPVTECGFVVPAPIPLPLAPKSGGLEGFQFASVALAVQSARIDGLWGLTSSTASMPPLALSGDVMLPGALKYDGGATTPLTFPGTGGAMPSFLGLPAQPTISTATRSLSMPAIDVPGGALHRLVVTGSSGEWDVWFPPGETVVNVPPVPGGFPGADDFNPMTGVPSFRVDSATLGLDGDRLGRTYTYDDVVTFQLAGPTLDDLSLQLDQFSMEEVSNEAN